MSKANLWGPKWTKISVAIFNFETVLIFFTDEYFQKPRQNSRDLNNEDDENVENVDTDVNGAYRDILGPTL